MRHFLGAAAVAALLAAASPASAAFVFNTGELGGTPVNLVANADSTVQTGNIGVGGELVTFTSTNLLHVVTGAAALESTPLTNLTISFLTSKDAVGWNVDLIDLVKGGGPDDSNMGVSINGGSTAGVDFFTVASLKGGSGKYNITTTGTDVINTLAFTFNPGVGAQKQFRITGIDDSGGGGSGGPVPEPATWAMMIMGFFGLGSMMRRRRLATLAA